MYPDKNATFVTDPFQINLELTTACNYSCRHCAVSLTSYPAKTMAKETAFSMLEDLKRMAVKPYYIQLSGHGESTILPWFDEFIRLVRLALPKTSIGFQTNGSKLGSLAETLVEASCNLICISYDGGKRESFDFIRGEGAYEKLMNGIKKLNQVKADRRSPDPNLMFAVTLTRFNVFELNDIIDSAKQFKVDKVVVQLLTPYEELKSDQWQVRSLTKDEFVDAERAVESARIHAKNLEIEFEFRGSLQDEPIAGWNQSTVAQEEKQNTDFQTVSAEKTFKQAQKNKSFKICGDPWHTAFVTAYSKLNSCCFRLDDATESLSEVSFTEIWNKSTGLNKLRKDLLDGNLDTKCLQCPSKKTSFSPPVIPQIWTLDNRY